MTVGFCEEFCVYLKDFEVFDDFITLLVLRDGDTQNKVIYRSFPTCINKNVCCIHMGYFQY